MRRAVLAAAILAGVPVMLQAQVGHDPAHSPYRDLRQRQELTFFTGYYNAREDPARVAPQSGPLVGVHYQFHATGPLNLTADVGRISSERRVLDPELPDGCGGPDCKLVSTFRWPLYTADAGMALALTGARTYYGLVPELKAGVGLISDFHTRSDLGSFQFGTRFAFTWGGGLRWVAGGPFQMRVDLVSHLYSIKYPDSYYQPADDGSVIFPGSQSRTAWLNNPALTIGVSYLFSR